MKKLIRKSVFETNSLSSHSLSFKYEDKTTATEVSKFIVDNLFERIGSR